MAKSLAQAAMDAAKELRGIKSNLILCYQDTLLDIGTSLVYYTPLKTGLASSNWNVTTAGRISLEREPMEGEKGRASLDAMTEQVKHTDSGKDAIFHNPVDYIDDLENGTSRQAPAGMITPTLPRISDMWLENLNKYNLLE